MAKEVSVTVTGITAAGKSAVAEYIRQKLLEIGISASLNDDNGIGIVDEPLGAISNTLTERMDSLRLSKLAVGIRTNLAQRSSHTPSPELAAHLEEIRKLRHNIEVLTNALWKSCGDDEDTVNATIDSQGTLLI